MVLAVFDDGSFRAALLAKGPFEIAVFGGALLTWYGLIVALFSNQPIGFALYTYTLIIESSDRKPPPAVHLTNP